MRFIQLTDDMKQKALTQFQEMLNNQRSSTSSINFSFNLKNEQKNEKVIVNFTATAWLKLWSLVSSEKGEIGWHGIVEKVNKGLYLIKDIIMYPQYVTGTTVQTDDVGYGNWLHKELSDDEINNLRFHGHSHVNMSTSPSGVDTTWYNEILQGLSSNDFYIFGIFNKRDEYFMEIYDLAENTIYEKADITLNVLLDDNNYLDNWVTKAKEANLKEKPVESTISKYYPSKSTQKEEKNENQEEDEIDFEDFIQEITITDITKDRDLKLAIMKEINKRAFQENYFNTNYSRWYGLTDYQKIDTVQKYYKAKKSKANTRVQDIMTAQKNYYDKYYNKDYYNDDYYYGGFYD